MKAACLKGGRIVVETLPDPVPREGQILVRPLFTGICGSDLSLRKQMAAGADEAGEAALPVIVPGHEFSAEVVDVPNTNGSALTPGDIVTALPFTHDHEGPQTIGLSPGHHGGLATLSCVDAIRTFKVPAAVPPDLAALTEPLSVGLHASRLANRQPGPNLVVGCGPVGLAVILSLKLDGRGPVIAADFSAERRDAAEAIGADIVVDPASESPFTQWDRAGFSPSAMSPLLAREFRGLPPGANIFECTGVPGVLGEVVNSAMPHSHIIVAGVCPHQEAITPLEAIVRELSLEFSFAYRPEEFREALSMIGEHGELVSRLITSRRPLEETEAAFDALAKHPHEIKVLIEPGR